MPNQFSAMLFPAIQCAQIWRRVSAAAPAPRLHTTRQVRAAVFFVYSLDHLVGMTLAVCSALYYNALPQEGMPWNLN
jgi:hypothetical protein